MKGAAFSALSRATAPVRRRIQMAIARGVVSGVKDSLRVQGLQLEVLADETFDDVERLQEYGFTSHPHSGAEAAIVFVGGLRSHGLVVAVDDRRYRLRSLEEGEVAIYDDQGQVVHLTRDGIIIATDKKIMIEAGEELLIKSDAEVKVEATSVLVQSDSVSLGAEGGPAVARVGDPVVGGVIQSGSTKVTAA